MFRKSHLVFPLAPKSSLFTIPHFCLWLLSQSRALQCWARLCILRSLPQQLCPPASFPLHSCSCVFMPWWPYGELCWVACCSRWKIICWKIGEHEKVGSLFNLLQQPESPPEKPKAIETGILQRMFSFRVSSCRFTDGNKEHDSNILSV